MLYTLPLAGSKTSSSCFSVESCMRHQIIKELSMIPRHVKMIIRIVLLSILQYCWDDDIGMNCIVMQGKNFFSSFWSIVDV